MFDPIMIYGFSIVHIVVPTVIAGLVVPRWFNWIIPVEKIPVGDKPVAPMETIDDTLTIQRATSEEGGVAYEENQEVKVKE